MVTHLGVGEKAAAKGHRYLTLVYDLTEATVEFIGDDRKQASLDAYFTGLTRGQRDGIEAIALDMWEPYVQSLRAHVRDAEAKMVFGRYQGLNSKIQGSSGFRAFRLARSRPAGTAICCGFGRVRA